MAGAPPGLTATHRRVPRLAVAHRQGVAEVDRRNLPGRHDKAPIVRFGPIKRIGACCRVPWALNDIRQHEIAWPTRVRQLARPIALVPTAVLFSFTTAGSPPAMYGEAEGVSRPRLRLRILMENPYHSAEGPFRAPQRPAKQTRNEKCK